MEQARSSQITVTSQTGDDEVFDRNKEIPKEEETRRETGGSDATQFSNTICGTTEDAVIELKKGGNEFATEEGRSTEEKPTEPKDPNDPSLWRVTFEPNDPENPYNWSDTYKWFLTAIGAITTFNVTFSSSAPSMNVPQIMMHYHISEEVATLLISMFVAGFCCGPLIFGPLSELYGRRVIFAVSLIPYTAFCLGAAAAPNTGGLIVLRFLAGAFGSCPLTNAGALIADLWDHKKRGIAISFFAVAPLAGPALGPSVAGFIAATNTYFRWTFWVISIFAGVVSAFTIIFIPETYGPLILEWRAKKRRQETGEQRWWADHEKADRSIKGIFKDNILRPFTMLIEEPMLLALTAYMSYIYGLVYLLFEAYPFIFGEIYHLDTAEIGLSFLTIFVGGFIATIISIVWEYPRYLKLYTSLHPQRVPPEERLIMSLLGGILLPVSLFWLAWSCYKSINVWSCLIAATCMGASILWVFLSLLAYIVDAYTVFAASGLAACMVVRSFAGAGFPLFANQMYRNVGTHWATAALAFIALAGSPIPFVLYYFGPKLRAMSKNSPEHFTKMKHH